MRLWTGAGGAAAGGEADNIYRVNIKQHLYQETGGEKNTQAESKLLMT